MVLKISYTVARAVVREEGTDDQLSVERYHGLLSVNIGSPQTVWEKPGSPTYCEMLITLPFYTLALSL